MGENIGNGSDNSVNEASPVNREGLSPGRCPVGEQRRPSRHPATARVKRTKQMKFIATEYYRGKPLSENGVPNRGYPRGCTENGVSEVCLQMGNKEYVTRLEQ